MPAIVLSLIYGIVMAFWSFTVWGVPPYAISEWDPVFRLIFMLIGFFAALVGLSSGIPKDTEAWKLEIDAAEGIDQWKHCKADNSDAGVKV